MKKILKPAEREEAIYFTDFKGKSCGEFDAPVELKMSFSYGSEYDGDSLVLHLNDEEARIVLDVIKQNISEDYKKHLKEKLKKTEESYEASMQCRDWTSCEYETNSLNLFEYMLNLKEEK